MDNIIEKYYKGITQILKGEVDFINTIVNHTGIKGTGNEKVLQNLLLKYLPKRFGIDTGIIIDKNGNFSRQCDIVIYDKYLYPSLFSLTNIHIFPVDLVYAVIEIKTTLTSKASKEAIQNISSVKKLEFIKNKFMLLESRSANTEFNEHHIAGIECTPSPPLGIIFSYNSNFKKFETFKKWFNPENNSQCSLYPNIVVSLDQGIIKFMDIYPKNKEALEAYCIPLLDKNNKTISPKSNQYILDGYSYPVKKVCGKNTVIDQSRILLTYFVILHESLTIKYINPSIKFSENYFKEYLKKSIYTFKY